MQRLAVLGAVEFSSACLQGILSARDVPRPDLVIGLAPDLSRLHTDYSDLADTAIAAGLPAASVRSANDALTVELLQSFRIDLLLVVGWSEILAAGTLAAVARAVGSHPSLLPQGRGHHPLIWPLVLGHERTGVTFFELTDRVDAGPMLWQRDLPVGPHDTARDLYDRASRTAIEGLEAFLPLLVAGELVGQLQDEPAATYWPKRRFEDGRIDPTGSVRTAYNLVRALSEPYPGAHVEVKGKAFKVWRALPSDTSGGNTVHPGQVTRIDGRQVGLRCRDAELVLLQHELDLGELRVGDNIGVR